ncbi:hypothetical protein VAR608DRAFT_3198 [Variovorax sp. HW608]|nr:hypothetical protein VAR608DRAFT_3198 [Variovorax sp. HW608]
MPAQRTLAFQVMTQSGHEQTFVNLMLEPILMVLAVAGLFLSYFVGGMLYRRGRRIPAIVSPLFIFLPTALICLGQIRRLTVADVGAIVGFALLISFCNWLTDRGW